MRRDACDERLMLAANWDLIINAMIYVVEVFAQYAHIVLVVPNFRAVPPHAVQPIRVSPLLVTQATVPCYCGVS